VEKPPKVIYIPKPWQTVITKFIIDHPRCNIWSDMGSGKTGSTLSAFDVLLMAGSNFFPALVLAPLRVARDVWPAEVNQWDHLDGLRVSQILGSVEDRRRALNRTADVYTINYENIPWLVDHLNGAWPFKTVVADESTRLKGHRLNKGTHRAKKLAQIARKTGRWINLTGTPSPNGLKDLWGQCWFLDFGQRLLDTYTKFSRTWFIPDPYTGELTPQPFAMDQIQKALSDITLTIQMKDWIDLKEPIIHNIKVDMPKAQLKEYRQLERDMFVTLQNQIELNATSAAAVSTKCLQFAAGAVYHEGDKWTTIHDTKLDALEEIVGETAGANLLISYWWKHDASRILQRFPKARLLKTQKDMQDWNEGKVAMGLVHPQSAGHGLNLQHGGHHIVHYSLWWNLEAYLQVNERLGPMRQLQAGYDRPVYVHHILMNNTLDEDVYDRLQSKRSVQDSLMSAMKRRME
jgi:SNF2 family DNA or RNA helicase